MLCALVLCVLLLSLNSSKAEGLPTMEARTVTRKFQNALTQQNLQTVLLSIEERLRNLDNIYAMQYSPSVEGKLEMYGRKLESVEAKISRLEAVMGNELDKISENISSRNFKDDLGRDHVLRKIDSVYERMNHRLIFAESKMELIERKLENKLDTVLSKMDKMEGSLEIKDADMQGEIADVLTCIEELKTQTENVEQKLNNITKTLNRNSGQIQSDATALSLTSENITATMKKDMKDNFEVLSNKIVDFHETSWLTYDRLEKTLRSMSLVSNLTRYEIQNGLRSLTVEVGRLSGGQSLLSDSSTGKSKLHEIDKKIDSNFESLMLAQNLFMENCYRLQKDEPQLETKISEVLDEMISTFNAKTAVAPKDIKKLEQAIKNHDTGVKNALKSLSTILHKSHVTSTKMEDDLSSLISIKLDLNKLSELNFDNNTTNQLTEKVEDAVRLLKNLHDTSTNIKPSTDNDITNSISTCKFQETIDKLENLTNSNSYNATLDSIKGHIENVSKIIGNIEDKTNIIGFIFTEPYNHHFQLFLDDYAKKYLNKVNEIFNNDTSNTNTDVIDNSINLDILKVDNKTIEAIRRNCFDRSDLRNVRNSSIFNCLRGILDEDQIRTIKIYCIYNTTVSNRDCLRNIIGLELSDSVIHQFSADIINIIKTNCFSQNSANLSNFECLKGVLNKSDLEIVKIHCFLNNAPSDEACLRNITAIEEFDQDTRDVIKANCFPSFDIRRLPFENSSSFQCLKGIVNEDIISRIIDYCNLNNISSEDDCLRNITRDVSTDIHIKEIIQIIRANCIPAFSPRNSEELSLSKCVNAILNESTIQIVKEYCSRNKISPQEDCLRNITNLNPDVVSIKESNVEIIKTNCLPEIDIRSSISISDCAKKFVSENDLSRMQNYCYSTLRMSMEECLRNLTGFKLVNTDIIEKINPEIRQIIAANCFPEIDIRTNSDTSSFQCLIGILDENDIESIRTYCSSIMMSAEACLKGIINGNSTKANVTKRNDDGDDGDGNSNIKVNSSGAAESSGELLERMHSINATVIARETTTETDYYQASETAERNEYDDYGLGVY